MNQLNVYSLVAVFAFAVAFLGVYGAIYRGALAGYKRGELDAQGVRILRLGLYGHLVVFAILGITALLV